MDGFFMDHHGCFSRVEGEKGAHLVIQQAVLVSMRSLVRLHLLPGHSSQLLGQLPPPRRYLDRRGQQDEIQDQSGNQTLAVHLQQGLSRERRQTGLKPEFLRLKQHLERASVAKLARSDLMFWTFKQLLHGLVPPLLYR